jgi:hypothetical protein
MFIEVLAVTQAVHVFPRPGAAFSTRSQVLFHNQEAERKLHF